MILTPDKAAEYLGRKKGTLMLYVRQGKIEPISGPNYRSGYLFHTDDLDRLRDELGINREGTITASEIRDMYLVDRGDSFTRPSKDYVNNKIREFGLEPIAHGRGHLRFFDRGRVLLLFDQIWHRRDQILNGAVSA